MSILGTAVGLLQMPFYIVWFLGLRDICFEPENYPMILNQGFFWIKNVAEMDPLYILPFLSGYISHLTIKLTFKQQSQQNQPMVIKRLKKYFPYLPFFGVIFLTQFPAGLSLNWAVIAAYNYLIIKMLNSEKINQFFGIPEYYPNTHLAKKLEGKSKSFLVDQSFQSDSNQY